MKKKRFRIPIIGLICCMLLGTIAFAVNGRKITATYGGITIYLNGIGIYGVCYFCALLLAFAVGGVLGAFSVKTILFGLGGFLCNMLFFFCCIARKFNNLQSISKWTRNCIKAISCTNKENLA